MVSARDDQKSRDRYSQCLCLSLRRHHYGQMDTLFQALFRTSSRTLPLYRSDNALCYGFVDRTQ